MDRRKILVGLALVFVIISIQPAIAQTTIEINPRPAIVYAPLPYGLDPSMGNNEKLKHENNVLMCRIHAEGSLLQIGSPQYQTFMQQCVAEMERKY